MSKNVVTPPEFSTLKSQIDELHISQTQFLAIRCEQDTFCVAQAGADVQRILCRPEEPQPEQIVAWLREQMDQHQVKFIGAALTGEGELERLAERLWLDLDCVPFLRPAAGTSDSELQKLAVWVSQQVNDINVFNLDINGRNEVYPAFLTTLAAYREITPDYQWKKLLALADEFQGKRMIFVNATPRGGGVALMRHALIRLYQLLGVDAHWHVLQERKEVFDVTKTKFHNVLQAVAKPDIELTKEEQQLYLDWTDENYQVLKPEFEKADVVVIDDPQPAGLIPLIRRDFPDKKIHYRSHIQIEGPLVTQDGTPQATTWNFLWNFIQHADSFLCHPVSHFIPGNVPEATVMKMPATTDPLDGLNKPLNEQQVAYYRSLFHRTLLTEGQQPLDPDRNFIAQVARFDPSKGIPDVVESYRVLVDKLKAAGKSVPQLVIAGHGSVDDPDGGPILALTLKLLHDPKYRHLANDVKVARLDHIDQLLNFLLQESTVVLQLSHKEGFEIKVSEALMTGKPVVVYEAGGIPLQVVQGESGFIVEVGNTQQVAERLFDLLTDTQLYERMCKGALEKIRPDVTTVSNAIAWLWLGLALLNDTYPGHSKPVFDSIFPEQPATKVR